MAASLSTTSCIPSATRAPNRIGYCAGVANREERGDVANREVGGGVANREVGVMWQDERRGMGQIERRG